MSDLPLLIDAAHAAGRLMLERRGHVRTRRKPDGSPVTDADLEVDALLHDTLTAARPGYGWLSEETADDLQRLDARRTFVVDPIDGTTAYLNGTPWFAVSLVGWVVSSSLAVSTAVRERMSLVTKYWLQNRTRRPSRAPMLLRYPSSPRVAIWNRAEAPCR